MEMALFHNFEHFRKRCISKSISKSQLSWTVFLSYEEQNSKYQYTSQISRLNINLFLIFSVFMLIVSKIIEQNILITQIICGRVARKFAEIMTGWISYSLLNVVIIMLLFVKYGKNSTFLYKFLLKSCFVWLTWQQAWSEKFILVKRI